MLTGAAPGAGNPSMKHHLENTMTKRVAVIGAGPSGLAQLRAFQSAKEKGADKSVALAPSRVLKMTGDWMSGPETPIYLSVQSFPDKNSSPIARTFW